MHKAVSAESGAETSAPNPIVGLEDEVSCAYRASRNAGTRAAWAVARLGMLLLRLRGR
jgi:hypothetical protein